MGVGTTLEYVSKLFRSGKKKEEKEKKKQLQTVELKVKMDCEGCELKIKKALSSLQGLILLSVFLWVGGGCIFFIRWKLIFWGGFFSVGVESVDIDRKQQKVTVIGYAEASKVLKKVQSTGKKAELWPYVPYNAVAHAYTTQAYDKKAPPGQVKNVEVLATSNPGAKPIDELSTIFSDDNPNSCSIM